MSSHENPISPLRQRITEDMTLRKLAPKTQSGYPPIQARPAAAARRNAPPERGCRRVQNRLCRREDAQRGLLDRLHTAGAEGVGSEGARLVRDHRQAADRGHRATDLHRVPLYGVVPGLASASLSRSAPRSRTSSRRVEEGDV